MIIKFDFKINFDTYEQLIEDFNTVEYIEIPGNEDEDEGYDQVVLDTKDLSTLEFDDWLEPWLLNHELKMIKGEIFLTY